MATRPKLTIPHYAELWCLSNFSFLRGASHPHELVERAHAQGYRALALTDECSLAGIVRAHVAARDCGLPLIVGAQFEVQPSDTAAPAFTLVALACNLHGYGNLCALITQLRRKSPKGSYALAQSAIHPRALQDCLLLLAPSRQASPAQIQAQAAWLQQHFAGRCWLAVQLDRSLGDEAWLAQMRAAGSSSGAPLVAAGNVHMHVRSRKPMQDVLTAIRLRTPLTDCGYALQPNAEQHLRSRLRLAQMYPPDLLEASLGIAARCQFSLTELRYQYPDEVVPPQLTPAAYLRQLSYEGAARRWPQGTPPKVQATLEKELALISELQYEHYFLTVYDIVRFARSKDILCQGRGSAANSAVCYCLHITEVDPDKTRVLFERFISKERNEPPDIDVDFEHARREEVIQYLYKKYGLHRAGLTAVVIRYRRKSAIRDVAKALGFALPSIDLLARDHSRWDDELLRAEALAQCGLQAGDLAVRQLQELVETLRDFPRHLSQHVGGFVLTRGPLSRIVPIERASMENRTVIQWDKDDLDAVGLLKVDVLALGMLTALQKMLHLVGARQGRSFALGDIPHGDEPTYDMICAADTIGVFQIESRAQMSMLPRLRPRKFYDLVIEVALVRPGPIQGGMVHPYLRRRQGLEKVQYESELLRPALERTLGVPIFQEQVMQIAIDAAGFSAGEADQLRRSMAAWRRTGNLQKYYDKIINGMTGNGYSQAFAESIFQQIQGFSEYGFPESHAASFAILVYFSAWIKCHYPAEFLVAMINSQPLGFYSNSQLIQDAKRHGVQVLPVDVMHSGMDCSTEPSSGPYPAVRLGLRLVKQLQQTQAARLLQARDAAPFVSAQDLARRAQLDAPAMKYLAAADALASLEGHRRNQLWQASAPLHHSRLLRAAPIDEDELQLPAASEQEDIHWDYAALGLSLRRHPMALLRERLQRHRFQTQAELREARDGSWVRACGIVTLRQQPPTAKGVIFITLEDETGNLQVICWPHLRSAQRDALLHAQFLAVQGRWQRSGEVGNLIAHQLRDVSDWFDSLRIRSRDFR
ncbi:error-prone DNA polymerase [Comamonas sediminis]|uniref:Error-prone DNA polymerase n=1 Tax=Comamonas sediminis TaxID=1783360 RepID=A0ABV4AYY6_9BURK